MQFMYGSWILDCKSDSQSTSGKQQILKVFCWYYADISTPTFKLVVKYICNLESFLMFCRWKWSGYQGVIAGPYLAKKVTNGTEIIYRLVWAEQAFHIKGLRSVTQVEIDIFSIHVPTIAPGLMK